MTVEQSTDASTTPPPLTWETIDWPRVRQEVRRLQMRIAKAVQAGHWRKVHALQWVLTHSRSAKLLAVHRVTTNRGAKTPGVDNVRWRTNRQKLQAAYHLKRHGYRPWPLRRVYIPKPNGKLRPLSIPTLHDRAMQALYALALAPIVESLADPNSYGFREGRCCADALEQCFTVLARKTSASEVLEGDIRACFDEISQEWLLAHVPMDKRLLRAWLQAGYFEGDQLHLTLAGTPQGGLISPLLANFALDGMEQALRAATQPGDKVNFVRYADDFVVTGATRVILEQKALPALTAFLHPRGLALSEQKTVITSLQEVFDFLRHTLRKYGDKLLITPAKRKVQALRQKIRRVFQAALGRSQAALLRQLNPLLRGWANYYRNGAAKAIFSKLDHYVWHKIRRWINRRHPKKSLAWKKATYFSAAGDKGDFSVAYHTKKGQSRVLSLYRMASTPIERHLKVRGAANPYDPRYTQYFAQRRCFAWRIRRTSPHTPVGAASPA